MRLTVFFAFLGLTVAHLSTNVMQKLPFLRTEEQKGEIYSTPLQKFNQNYLFIHQLLYISDINYQKYFFIQKKMVFLIWRIS